MTNDIDIKENDILKRSPELLNNLLKDQTLSANDECHNIFWATHDYEDLGDEYNYYAEIKSEYISGKNGTIIKPRIVKSTTNQTQRKKDKAEVFTPAWVCNAQINLIDESFFQRKNVFNTEINKNNSHSWRTNKKKIKFPDCKDWTDYVKDTRLEITCGEAPYITSRYDTTSGQPIEIEDRIGVLDRKLRVVSENTKTIEDYIHWSKIAYQNVYGYEWQGDNLLLARESMLYTFIDYYQAKFNQEPQFQYLIDICDIITWNVFQMDGLRGVIPDSCGERKTQDLFYVTINKCMGCQNGNILQHNGIYCKVKDWETDKQIRFIDLIK